MFVYSAYAYEHIVDPEEKNGATLTFPVEECMLLLRVKHLNAHVAVRN